MSVALPTNMRRMVMAQARGFLSALPTKTRDLIKPHLTEVKLERGATVARPHSKLEVAYLPIDCVLSVDFEMSGGVTFCTGLIGSDGILGAGMSLDDRVCLYGVKAITGGSAFVLTMSRLKDLLLQIPELRKRALAYDQFFLAQVQQTAACSALHEATERLSSWLLRMRNYAGNEISLTQNALAQMLGVRRTTVTEAALALQREGAIDYRRGEISILIGEKVKQLSCGCETEIASHYCRLFEAKFSDD